MTLVNWEDSEWKKLFLVGDEEVFSLSHTRFTYFQILYHALER